MKRKRFILLLAPLLMAATGAWAQEPATTYSVKMKDGTVDAKNWTIASGQKSATGDAADGLTGLSKKDAVTLTYGGRLKVKSVTATTDAEPPAPVEGKFTINANGDQVNFAKGNLQATFDGNKWTWGFAEHQYDYIGNNAANTTINADGTTSENGTVDLFGWVGTSGTLTGIAYGISNVGYELADAAYGNKTTDQLKHDWGELIGDGKTWRVLTAAEWDYVVNKRKDEKGFDVDRYAKATVNGVPGLILFPDEYEHPNGVTKPTNNINVNSSSAKFGDYQYDLAAWTLMENAGCIFLPASANRSKNQVIITPNYERGCYWTSTPHKSKGNCSYLMRFDYQSVGSATTENSARYYGNAVRLVKSATEETVWDGDLSKLTAESTEAYATATDGMTIKGTLAEGVNVKVSIADGATVTLDNAVINGVNNGDYSWAGISCLGDATIILKDDTENTVKGFNAYYPGIHVPSGKTLIIKGGDQGTGKLTASSNGWGAGIGGGYESGRPCGSIEIQGGNITATGGSYSAGIGGGYAGTCGAITITGGTVTATGGQYAPGIGGGYAGTCGDITIANTVTKVTATKDPIAPYSIGAGLNGFCGTVTIGGTKYWENNAAVDDDAEDYLMTGTITYEP